MTLIKWCFNCKYPTTFDKCSICGEKTKYICKDIRPVFFEEKFLLSNILGYSILNKSVWKIKNGAYIIDGSKINVPIENFKQINIKSPIHIQNNIDIENDFRKFIRGNSEYLSYISKESIDYVTKVAKKYKDFFPIISWSGGKDSTVVSDIVRKALENQKILHVFADTTIEFPSTYDYIAEFRSNNPYIPFVIARSDKDFKKLCEKLGPPSRVMRWCCSVFKTGPISQVFNEFFDSGVLTYYGIRRNESNSRAKYIRTVRSPKIKKQIVASPIINWLDFDIWLYILSNNLHFNDAYRMGFTRVGCLYCPNNSEWSENLSSIYFPKHFEKWKEFLYKFAKKINKQDYVEYIDSGNWKARHGGDGLDISDFNLDVDSLDCLNDVNSKFFLLRRKIDERLIEYLKPFGQISIKTVKDLYKVEIKNKSLKMILGWRKDDNILKVTLLTDKNAYLTFQRVQCQVRKYQACILCSACDSVCPNGAISTKNGNYIINEEKCNHCLKCIANFTGGCLLNKSLQQSKI